ncbi:disease resistance protein Pik-1-like [Triticum dicoccoides]|uniref:disease resistance protein Pik-1-like n=1 Tax=Triticum dicoccoides TaxID=85692 RepID=UPI000844BF55|nr:disease resistance protein Pik-1-like [Triticum dicoccoides]XP_044385065.1 disease resistance protein Pik-1-like [Triticum aestivum]
MTQKIVIAVQMGSSRCRSKALALVAATPGVDSVALAGDGKDQLVVVGHGVDSVKLTSALRRKVGHAQLLQVGDAKKEDAKKPPAAVVVEYYPYGYYYPSQPAPVNFFYEQQHYPAAAAVEAYGYPCSRPEPGTCSVM